ncbi:heterokaryon incompatibility protein-domain-containing protein [Phaeosphaeriaceae sp. PMI808]|nr:heterokaryon incompatibility protein-domain-containing protein [Phaeosphaeriaceae sp. PMI808]
MSLRGHHEYLDAAMANYGLLLGVALAPNCGSLLGVGVNHERVCGEWMADRGSLLGVGPNRGSLMGIGRPNYGSLLGVDSNRGSLLGVVGIGRTNYSSLMGVGRPVGPNRGLLGVVSSNCGSLLGAGLNYKSIRGEWVANYGSLLGVGGRRPNRGSLMGVALADCDLLLGVARGRLIMSISTEYLHVLTAARRCVENTFQTRLSNNRNSIPPSLGEYCKSCKAGPISRLLRLEVGSDTQSRSNPPPTGPCEICSPVKELSGDTSGQGGRPVILPKAGGKFHFLLLNDWLQTCDQQHIHPRLCPYLPTRVIYVGCAKDPNGLRLYNSEGALGLYIALSHRWGPNEYRYRTIKSNFEARLAEIKFEELPLMFRNAIDVTRKLGIKYLWIDSLCIIQDDNDDRRRQCSRMEDVFALAYCTLAATSAEDCEQGLFREDKGGHKSLCIREVDRKFSQDIEQAELNKRGWVFQERALSRRIIHFAATQTYWECGEMVSCESADQIGVAAVRDPNPLSSSDFPNCNSSNFQKDHSSAFKYTFTKYTKLSLTEKEDRQVAIAGLEARLERFYGTISAYGILKKFFHESLFWHRAGDNGLVWIEKLKDRSVPSWSWMAYIGEIGYIDLPISISDPCKDPQTNVRFTYGEFHPGKCALQARLAQVSWSSHINRNGCKNCEMLDSTKNLVGFTFCDEEHGKDGEVTEYDIKGISCISIAKGAAPFEELGGGDVHFVILVSPVEETGQNNQRAHRRLGVAFIKDGHLSFGDKVWVI